LYVRELEMDSGPIRESDGHEEMGGVVRDGPRRVDMAADAYDERWQRLAATGHDVHGEADLVERLVRARGISDGLDAARVLDAGCGTGRVAIRLAERGMHATGVDVDRDLLARAQAKAPALAWHEYDLAHLAPGDLPGPFDVIVLAGNVMIFLAGGTERTVLGNLATRLSPGGLLIAGFQLRPGGLQLDDYDAFVADAGLVHEAHFATWDGDEHAGGDYVVAVASAAPS
jgi:SAM-dependent methyltransferase